MANWYVKRGSETAGPLTQNRIKELAAQGKIEETDLIRKGDQGDFFPAGQIPGLLPDPESERPPTPQAPSSPANTPPARKKKHSSLPILLCIGFLAGLSFLFILPAPPILIGLLLITQILHILNNAKTINTHQ